MQSRNDVKPVVEYVQSSPTQSARERMLANIRASLEKNRDMLLAEAARVDHTPPPHVLPPADDLVAQFIAELTKLEGRSYRCADDAAALEVIRGLLQEHPADAIIAWSLDRIGVSGLAALLAEMGIRVADSRIAHTGQARQERLQALDAVPICISGVESAIAESGALVLLSGAGQGRLASLLAPIHIAVVRVAQLRRGLGEVLTELQYKYGPRLFADRSNLTIITGPSRTADIELTLTLGVHGPREVHVVLIDAETGPKVKGGRPKGRRVNRE